jgi:hypothetical protein
LWNCNPLWFLVFDVPGHRFSHLFAAYSWVPHFSLSLARITLGTCWPWTQA